MASLVQCDRCGTVAPRNERTQREWSRVTVSNLWTNTSIKESELCRSCARGVTNALLKLHTEDR